MKRKSHKHAGAAARPETAAAGDASQAIPREAPPPARAPSALPRVDSTGNNSSQQSPEFDTFTAAAEQLGVAAQALAEAANKISSGPELFILRDI